MTLTNGSESDEATSIAAYVNRVLGGKEPSSVLLEVLVELEAKSSLAVGVFEALAGRIALFDYWIYYRVSRAYFLLGRDDACFLTAVAAVQMEPTYQNWHMYENMFRYFRSRRRYRDAVEIARRQIAHTPEIPIIAPHELHDVVRLAKMEVEESFQASEARTNYVQFEKSTFTLQVAGIYGLAGQSSRCFALDRFAGILPRPEVVVSEVEEADVVVYDGNVLVFDNLGDLQSDISVCQFPEVLAQKILQPAIHSLLPVKISDVVIVISDKFATANVCHFLLDHVTRLALYEPFCSIETAMVVGPSLVTDYQKRIVARLGLRQYEGTTDRYIVRARRVLVSHTCKATFNHPAHLAAPWAIGFLRSKFIFKPAQSSASGRLYISRRDASVRFVRNEAEVLKLLEPAGFKSIALSDLDYDDQAALFANATHVVGMHGAGLTNMVFCSPEAHVLEICHPVAGTAAYAVVGSVIQSSYSALVGRDADSDGAAYNDAQAAQSALGMGGAAVASNRDVIVDIDELTRWLQSSGAMP